MMNCTHFIFYLLITSVVIFIKGEDCPEDRKNKERSWEAKLHEDLTSLMINDKGNTSVTFDVKLHFMLRSFNFDELEELFTISTYIMTSWTEKLMVWKPEDYGGISKLLIKLMMFRAPLITLMNAAHDEWYDYEVFDSFCSVYHTGKVNCIPKIEHTISCSSKIIYWPYDTKNCTFYFGKSDDISSKMNFSFLTTTAATLIGAEYGNTWDILDFTSGEIPGKNKKLFLSFLIERHAGVVAAMFVYPSIIAALITITTLFIKGDKLHRFGIVCFSILCHLQLLSQISGIIPKSSKDTPLLLMFIRNSLLVSVITLVLTYVLAYLRVCKVQPPSWVCLINKFLLNSTYTRKFIVFITSPTELTENTLNDAERDEETETLLKSMNEWKMFSNIANSISFVVIVTTYLGLFLQFMPIMFAYEQGPETFLHYHRSNIKNIEELI